ncbi:conserved hypothetical protein [Ricinus communis]|uniref:Isopenicillin N synthase-like Fe(2+) 2OG dioxygenase domain-containing protein n=1 Tax=Ricinus communis TaxID=3988 RepID=B9T7L3_RICCO|nr:conserved hypothetical protein [Ricinus communis]
MAMSLNLEDRCFLDNCGVQATMRARFNFFPPSSRHHQVLGLKPHSDSSVITIVLQDREVEVLDNYIEPLDGVVDETRLRLHKKVKNYFGSFAPYYQQGKGLIDAMKIQNF